MLLLFKLQGSLASIPTPRASAKEAGRSNSAGRICARIDFTEGGSFESAESKCTGEVKRLVQISPNLLNTAAAFALGFRPKSTSEETGLIGALFLFKSGLVFRMGRK